MGHHDGGLSFFASPLHVEKSTGHERPPSYRSTCSSPEHGGDVEKQPLPEVNAGRVHFENTDGDLQEIYNGYRRPSVYTPENPAFHRRGEATTAELFYDLFFVANLTTFSTLNEIDDLPDLTAYIGFFSLLWLTWYQVSIYDARFSTDSIFERAAKSIHFGTMVGFAVMSPQWKVGEAISDYTIFKAFGLTLMVSRVTLVAQYSVTFFYARRYPKARLPLGLVMASSLIAAILYGGLTGALHTSHRNEKLKGNFYIAWYVIALLETLLTVTVSCSFRVISFKGTHMVQRMSLLTLIILGEGIIGNCHSIARIVENNYLWSPSVVGQIIAAIMTIYFLYMLYFDRLQEDHFGSIKQQIWSFLHFPLHITFVLVLQGISNFVVWRQAVESLHDIVDAINAVVNANYDNGTDFANAMNETSFTMVFDYVPDGVDATKALATAKEAIADMLENYEFMNGENGTASTIVNTAVVNLYNALAKTTLDSLSLDVPEDEQENREDLGAQMTKMHAVLQLLFSCVFVAGGLALIFLATLGYLSLAPHQRRLSQYVRLGVNILGGVGLCLVSTIEFNTVLENNYFTSAWMVPTLCIAYFGCVVVTHVRVRIGKGKMQGEPKSREP